MIEGLWIITTHVVCLTTSCSLKYCTPIYTVRSHINDINVVISVDLRNLNIVSSTQLSRRFSQINVLQNNSQASRENNFFVNWPTTVDENSDKVIDSEYKYLHLQHCKGGNFVFKCSTYSISFWELLITQFYILCLNRLCIHALCIIFWDKGGIW